MKEKGRKWDGRSRVSTEQYKQNWNELSVLRKRNFIVPAVMIMEDINDLRDTYILNRGMYNSPTKQVSAGTPEIIAPFPDDYPKNRLIATLMFLNHTK